MTLPGVGLWWTNFLIARINKNRSATGICRQDYAYTNYEAIGFITACKIILGPLLYDLSPWYSVACVDLIQVGLIRQSGTDVVWDGIHRTHLFKSLCLGPYYRTSLGIFVDYEKLSCRDWAMSKGQPLKLSRGICNAYPGQNIELGRDNLE